MRYKGAKSWTLGVIQRSRSTSFWKAAPLAGRRCHPALLPVPMRPWNCATEGNEHAHQDMKNFFKHLANHNPNSKHGDCYQVLRMMVIKTVFIRTKAHLLPASNYASMRANHVLAQHAKRVGDKKRGAGSGPKGVKMYGDKEQARLARSAARVQADVVECRVCED